MRLAALLILGTLLLAACSAGETPSRPQPTSTQPTGRPAPSRTPQESVVIESLPPKGTTELTGTLGFDDVEGGCPYLAAADGTAYQVEYPEGWRVEPTTGVLTGPDGERIALGTQVTVRGVMTDMLSTCQIGPVFQASEVVTGRG